MYIRDNDALSMCSCGLYPLLSSGGVGGGVYMLLNALDGDCNNDGADISAGQCALGPLGALSAEVEALVADGILSASHGQALTNKVKACLKQSEKGNIQAAIDKLYDFIAQVENLLAEGKIGGANPEATAQALIAQAQAIIELLEGMLAP